MRHPPHNPTHVVAHWAVVPVLHISRNKWTQHLIDDDRDHIEYRDQVEKHCSLVKVAGKMLRLYDRGGLGMV
jgi:hypothetical protein